MHNKQMSAPGLGQFPQGGKAAATVLPLQRVQGNPRPESAQELLHQGADLAHHAEHSPVSPCHTCEPQLAASNGGGNAYCMGVSPTV